MPNTWVITGGARSGKSEYAENLASEKNSGVLYIATAVAYGDEMTERIAKHRADRSDTWITWERYRNFTDIRTEFDSESFDTILVDCVGNLLMGILFEEIPNPDDFSSEEFDNVENLSMAEIDVLIEYANKQGKRLIFVTNEIGMGIVPEGRYSRYYRDALGRINKHVVKEAEKAVFMVAGIPMVLK